MGFFQISKTHHKKKKRKKKKTHHIKGLANYLPWVWLRIVIP
jgi:hypothetical protein